jgi:hypothetical protein
VTCTSKLDEEKSKHVGLAQAAFLHNLLRLVEVTANLCTAKEECDKYDATPCF